MCIFTIFSFLSTSFFEVQEFDFSKQISVSEDHCADCKDDGCTDTGGGDCCQNFCLCTSFLFSKYKNQITLINKTYYSEIGWYFYTNYHSPLLDSALKPPLFS